MSYDYEDLSRKSLCHADLSGKYLHGANLSGADLSYANLRQTYLQGANLAGANLYGADVYEAYFMHANLSGVNLRGIQNLKYARHLTLSTGETLEQFICEVVPLLLTAGGKRLESFRAHWSCGWGNCPISHAFDTSELGGVPILLRPRADQFIQLFDAGCIPWEQVEKLIP